MELKFSERYINLSNKQIVDKIIAEPYDEEAAVYLIYDRYEPLFISVCMRTFGSIERLDELQSELFMLLKGRNQDWHVLKSFQWRSTFGTWLAIITYNLSQELRRQLIENDGQNHSIDEGWQQEDENPVSIDIPVDEEESRDRQSRIELLKTAIGMLSNPDQRFVVTQRLYGYSSKEVSVMLKAYWDKKAIVRYNSKGEIVVPDSGYIDNLFKRGYDKTKQIYKSLDK